MKREEQVDAVMQAIPVRWRTRWCGAEQGACACMGCVQTGNRQVIAEKITGEPWRGDPEYIDEGRLQAHGAVYTDNKVSRVEWEAWMSRQPGGTAEPSDGLLVCGGRTGGCAALTDAAGSSARKTMTLEAPPESLVGWCIQRPAP